jgi:hypothetical protein
LGATELEQALEAGSAIPARDGRKPGCAPTNTPLSAVMAAGSIRVIVPLP